MYCLIVTTYKTGASVEIREVGSRRDGEWTVTDSALKKATSLAAAGDPDGAWRALLASERGLKNATPDQHRTLLGVLRYRGLGV